MDKHLDEFADFYSRFGFWGISLSNETEILLDIFREILS